MANKLAMTGIVLIGLLILSCSKRLNSQLAADSPSPSTPTASPISAESPAVVAKPSEYHRLAQPGISYLLEYVSLKSDTGVIGFAPGTRLRLVEDKGDTIIVSDGTTKLEVAKTN